MFKVFKTAGIESNYSISSNALFTSNGSWAIYPAKHKTTKKKCSVWQFSKKDMETRLLNNGVMNKNNKTIIMNDIFESLKNYISNLAKVKHPNFLTVIEPLEDHKNRVLFVTEYVVDDLASLSKTDLDEIIITKGLLQIASGLKFLHQSINTIHLNLNPSSIFITENFDWKISGMQFIEILENKVEEKYIDPLDSRLPGFLSLDFKFTSPNLLLKHNMDYIDDLFSLGCLIYYLFNDGGHLIACSSSSLIEYERSYKRLNQALASDNLLNHATFSKIPQNYVEVFIRLLADTQESNKDVIQLKQTLTVDDLLSSRIFNNELIKILNVLDEFPTLSNNEKSQFLTNLTKEITQFPRVLLINKFIPILSDLITPYLKNTKKKIQPEEEQLITLSSENLLILSKELSQLTFTDKIFPVLGKVLSDLDLSSYKLLLIANLELIKQKLSANEQDLHSKNTSIFQTFLTQLFDKSMVQSNNLPETIQLQDKILHSLKVFLQFQSYTTITSKTFPSICELFSTTTSLKIKNLTIRSFILMINGMDDKNLDNYIIVEKLLPLVQNTSPSNFKNSNLLLNMIKLYENVFGRLSKLTSKISVAKNEVDVCDLITDSIFFQLWKLSKFISRQEDLNLVFKILDEIEAYLKNSITSNVKFAERERQQTIPASQTGNNLDDEEFGDFNSFDNEPEQAPVSKPIEPTPRRAVQPMHLQPQQSTTRSGFGASSYSPSPVNNTSTVQPMRPMATTTTQAAPAIQPSMEQQMKSQRQTQATSPAPTGSMYSVMQPMRATKVSSPSPSGSPMPSQQQLFQQQPVKTETVPTGSIDWSRTATATASPQQQQASNGWTNYNTNTNTNTQTVGVANKATNSGSFGMSFEPIKPTKKLNQNQGEAGVVPQRDFFDSLI